MKNLTLRKATAQDEQWIAKVYKESKKELGSFNLWQCWEKYLNGKSHETFTVLSNCAGFVRWGYSKKYQSYIIQDIGVLSEHRGKGYAKLLLDSVPKPLMLKCNMDNANGNAFYQKIGMNQAGETATKKGVKQIIWTCAV